MKDLRAELADKINRWVESHRSNSLMVLAAQAQIPYTTVHRLSQQKTEAPSFETVFPICQILLSPEDQDFFYERHFPQIYAWKKRQETKGGVDNNITSEIDAVCEEYVPYLVFAQALNRTGIKRSTVSRLYGEIGGKCSSRFVG